MSVPSELIGNTQNSFQTHAQRGANIVQRGGGTKKETPQERNARLERERQQALSDPLSKESIFSTNISVNPTIEDVYRKIISIEDYDEKSLLTMIAKFNQKWLTPLELYEGSKKEEFEKSENDIMSEMIYWLQSYKIASTIILHSKEYGSKGGVMRFSELSDIPELENNNCSLISIDDILAYLNNCGDGKECVRRLEELKDAVMKYYKKQDEPNALKIRENIKQIQKVQELTNKVPDSVLVEQLMKNAELNKDYFMEQVEAQRSKSKELLEQRLNARGKKGGKRRRRRTRRKKRRKSRKKRRKSRKKRKRTRRRKRRR